MKCRIEITIQTNKETGSLDVRMRRIGRVPRIFGGMIAGLYFSVQETVRAYIQNLGGKTNGDEIQK